MRGALSLLSLTRSVVSPPSLSRTLTAVELDLVRPVGDALLMTPADCDQVLRARERRRHL